MKHYALTIIMALSLALSLNAQSRPDRQALSEEDREKWLTEMRNYKHEFLARELELTKEQQQAFFPLYDQMDDELSQVAVDTRELVNKVQNDDSASDIEIESAARALFEQKGRESAIEIAYFEKLKETLTPKQLLSLKNAERKFTQKLVNHHGRLKSNVNRRKQ